MEIINVKINCHSSICIGDNIYVDPFKIQEKKHDAKVVFITHSHYDHLELSSIKKVANEKTIIVCEKSSAEILEKELKNKLLVVAPNQAGEVCGIKFSTFPAYNVGHHHFRQLGFVGYNLEIEGIKYTICGDTDDTPELEQIETDVLLIPIGGTFTMNAIEAAHATNTIKPKVVIPTHYNCIVGSKEDEKKFVSLVDKNIQVEILVP